MKNPLALRRTFLAVGLFAPLAACFFWDSGDSPPPILGPAGRVDVTPRRIEVDLAPPLSDAGAPSDEVSVRVRARTATGAGAESRSQIGWVIVGGMTLGTLLTLIVVPTVYSLIGRIHHTAHGEIAPGLVHGPAE